MPSSILFSIDAFVFLNKNTVVALRAMAKLRLLPIFLARICLGASAAAQIQTLFLSLYSLSCCCWKRLSLMAHCFGYYFCLFPFRRLCYPKLDNAQSFASFFVCSTSLDTCAIKNTCSPVVFLDTCTCATCLLSVVFWSFLFLFLPSSFLASSF